MGFDDLDSHHRDTVEKEVIPRPHGKDVDERTVVELRRMLENAGYHLH